MIRLHPGHRLAAQGVRHFSTTPPKLFLNDLFRKMTPVAMQKNFEKAGRSFAIHSGSIPLIKTAMDSPLFDVDALKDSILLAISCRQWEALNLLLTSPLAQNNEAFFAEVLSMAVQRLDEECVLKILQSPLAKENAVLYALHKLLTDDMQELSDARTYATDKTVNTAKQLPHSFLKAARIAKQQISAGVFDPEAIQRRYQYSTTGVTQTALNIQAKAALHQYEEVSGRFLRILSKLIESVPEKNRPFVKKEALQLALRHEKAEAVVHLTPEVAAIKFTEATNTLRSWWEKATKETAQPAEPETQLLLEASLKFQGAHRNQGK